MVNALNFYSLPGNNNMYVQALYFYSLPGNIMYVPGDCNILLIYVCDLCYRKKKKNIKSPNVFLNTNVNDFSKFFYPTTRATEKKIQKHYMN